MPEYSQSIFLKSRDHHAGADLQTLEVEVALLAAALFLNEQAIQEITYVVQNCKDRCQ